MEESKDYYLKTLIELLAKQMANKTEPFKDNFLPGIVVDNNDPDKIGKCKIRIRGLMDSLSDNDCPWACPDHGFVGSLQSSFTIPPIGSVVNCYFRNGDTYNPFYTTRVLDINSLPDERLDDYPDSIVLFKTDPGDYFLINTKTNEMVIRSAGGQTIKFSHEGTIDIETINTLIGNINITARNLLTVDARYIQSPNGQVVPTGTGFMCAMPLDPLTGGPQTGSYFVRQGT